MAKPAKRHSVSKVDLLPEPIRHTVGRLLATNHTIDQVVAHLRQLEAQGEEFDMPSRSGVGRWAENIRAAQERITRSRAIAEALVPKLGENAEMKLGQLAAQMLETVVFDLMNAVEYDEETGESRGVHIGPKEAQALAKSLQSVALAQKTQMQTTFALRQEMAKEAATAVDKIGKQKGLSAETVEDIKFAVLGIAK